MSWKCIHRFAGPTHGKPSEVVKGDYIASSGYVLIINNDPIITTYPFGLGNAEKRVFAEKFGFTTREDNHLTTSDMLKAPTDTAKRDFSNNDCFCCIIRSTGTEHGIHVELMTSPLTSRRSHRFSQAINALLLMASPKYSC